IRDSSVTGVQTCALPISDVKYRGIVRAGGRTYVFGYREGRIVDPVAGLRESDAVVTRVSTDPQSWTVRPANGRRWWEWSGTASRSEERRVGEGGGVRLRR